MVEDHAQQEGNQNQQKNNHGTKTQLDHQCNQNNNSKLTTNKRSVLRE
jgi:hypothetical protein